MSHNRENRTDSKTPSVSNIQPPKKTLIVQEQEPSEYSYYGFFTLAPTILFLVCIYIHICVYTYMWHIFVSEWKDGNIRESSLLC